jgi:uncharacterized membrane protein YgdD (TMEM256/DUF423 family)
MQQASLWIGPALCALAIIAGAFGAHGLKARLTTESLALWETAARYLIYTGFGLTLLGLAGRQWPRPGLDWAVAGLLAGGLIFSGTVAALALGGPRWLGAVTPLGGLLLILGFAVFAWTAFRLG